ncbi:DUF5615 family PIN-like protein [Dyadobacter crusticola]|uniref:DUF5615 family PIN-like protein n=1 Tax=Dyadobacter crusticola TaxID=292407 RepID=UPI0004E0C675|nr:DUF5615 family PIN-like protein [Dyadobacter crusticola]
MKLLLDENLPKRLKTDFPDHDVFTIRDLGWNGKKDGELLSLLEAHHFDALLTFDKNMKYQNFKRANITEMVLSAKINSYEELSKLTNSLRAFLKKPTLPPGVFTFRAD